MPLCLDYIDRKKDGTYTLKEYNCEFDTVSLVPFYDDFRYRPKRLKKRIDDLISLVEKHYGPVTLSETCRVDVKQRNPVTRYPLKWLFKKKEDPEDLIFDGSNCLEKLVAEKKFKRRSVKYFNLEFQTSDGAIRCEIKPGDYKNLRWKFKMELLLGTAALGAVVLGYNYWGQPQVGTDTLSELFRYVKENYNMEQVVNDFKQFWGNLNETQAGQAVKDLLSFVKVATYTTYGVIIGKYLERIAWPYFVDTYNGMKIELSPLKTSYTEADAKKYKTLYHQLTMYNVDNYTFGLGTRFERMGGWIWKQMKKGGLWVGGQFKDLGYSMADSWNLHFGKNASSAPLSILEETLKEEEKEESMTHEE